MKVSELTAANLATYLKIESEDLGGEQEEELTGYLDQAKAFAMSYTGRDAAYFDEHADLTIAVLCQAGDYYTRRDMVTNMKGVGTASVNKSVQTILDMHSCNLVPTE